MRPPSGRLLLWPQHALVLGASFDSRPHAHLALQLVCSNAPFRLHLDGAWHDCSAAAIAPNTPHQIDSCGQRLIHLFAVLPPGLRLQQAQANGIPAAYASAPGFALLQQAMYTLLQGSQMDEAACAHADALCAQWLALVLERPAASQRTRLHTQRMQRTLATIAQALASQQTIQADTLAAQIHISPSRFAHWFRAQSGLTLSRYLLWQRLQLALQAVAAGMNLTAAAHAAGFADAAHMSRSFHATIGVAPSLLQNMTILFKPVSDTLPTMDAFPPHQGDSHDQPAPDRNHAGTRN